MLLPQEIWLDSLHDFIVKEMSNPDLNNAQISAALRTSESTLHRRLVAITGITPLKYVRGVRLQRAKELLLSGDYKTIKAVAHEVGFLKVPYFSQQYEKAFGERPSQVLQKNI